MSKENIFDGESPSNVNNLKDLFSFPPTVIWRGDFSDEKITSKIIRKSPKEDEWNFSIDCKSDEKKDNISFTISKNEEGEWVSKINKSTSLYSDIQNNIDELLDNFKISTFGISATLSFKHSADYEKEASLNAKSNLKDEDLFNPEAPIRESIRFKR